MNLTGCASASHVWKMKGVDHANHRLNSHNEGDLIHNFDHYRLSQPCSRAIRIHCQDAKHDHYARYQQFSDGSDLGNSTEAEHGDSRRRLARRDGPIRLDTCTAETGAPEQI